MGQPRLPKASNDTVTSRSRHRRTRLYLRNEASWDRKYQNQRIKLQQTFHQHLQTQSGRRRFLRYTMSIVGLYEGKCYRAFSPTTATHTARTPPEGQVTNAVAAWQTPCAPRLAGCSPDTRQSSSPRTWGSASRSSDPHLPAFGARCSWKRCRCCPGSRCRCRATYGGVRTKCGDERPCALRL